MLPPCSLLGVPAGAHPLPPSERASPAGPGEEHSGVAPPSSYLASGDADVGKVAGVGAPTTANQSRLARPGASILVCSQCQPPHLLSLNPHFGIGLAQRLLGRLATHQGYNTESTTALEATLAVCTTIQARYELTYTHLDLAALAHTQDNSATVTTHLSTAHAWFSKLQVLKWIEKTKHLAQEYGLTLTEVAVEETVEGSDEL